MAKRAASPDAIFDRLTALRQIPSSPEFDAELRRAIGHPSFVVVGRGAELAARYEKKELSTDLVAAYRRLSGDVRPADDNFIGRTAIVRSLVDLYAGGEAADVYLDAVKKYGRAPAGVMLPDSGAELRATAAMGLVGMSHPSALTVCTDLMTDRAPMVRIAAVRALAATGREAAALVLRLTLRHRDPDGEVTAECVTAIMQLLPAESMDVAVEMLRHEDDGVRAAAALAIGTSKQPGVLEPLRSAFARESEPAVAKAILVAAAGTRSADAVDWLLTLMNRGKQTAVDVIEALSPYRLDTSVATRLRKLVDDRGELATREAFAKWF